MKYLKLDIHYMYLRRNVCQGLLEELVDPFPKSQEFAPTVDVFVKYTVKLEIV